MEVYNKLYVDKNLLSEIKKFILNNIKGNNIIIYIEDLFLFINTFYTLLNLKHENSINSDLYENINIKNFKIIISNSLNHKSFFSSTTSNHSENIELDSLYIDDNILLQNINKDLINNSIIQDDDNNLKEIFKNLENEEFYLHTSGSTNSPVLIKKTIKEMMLESEYLSNFIKNILYSNKEINNLISNLNEENSRNKLDLINKIYYSDNNNNNSNNNNLLDKVSICSIVPHNHMYGLTHNIFLSIYLDASLYERKPVYENLSLFKEDILITSPEFLKNLILMNKELIPNEFKKIKIIISAGSVLSENVREEIRKITDAIVINTYGSTETGVIAGDIGFGLYTYGSVNITSDSNNNYIESNWVNKFMLQDILEVNNNEIKIIGRNDRIIKIADKRFSLDRIEQVISDNSFIKDCFAYNKNNRIGVLVELSESGIELYRNYGKKGIVTEITKDSSKEFGKNIRYIKIVSKIYRNNNGKLSLKENMNLIDQQDKFEYKLVEENADELKYKSKISVSEFYFKDHFYEFPIVPGFIELDSVIKLLNEIGYDYTRIRKISNLKFTSFIRPNEDIMLKIIKKDNVIKFEITSNNDKLASGSIAYE